MSNRFFIDECISASLVAVAKERGLAADFGPHIGMAGWQDWNIVRFALDNGYIVVTNNRRDFLREYMKHDLHVGLVIIVPHADRDRQVDLFNRAQTEAISRVATRARSAACRIAPPARASRRGERRPAGGQNAVKRAHYHCVSGRKPSCP